MSIGLINRQESQTNFFKESHKLINRYIDLTNNKYQSIEINNRNEYWNIYKSYVMEILEIKIIKKNYKNGVPSIGHRITQLGFCYVIDENIDYSSNIDGEYIIDNLSFRQYSIYFW